jgi:glycosyltransferase involved in cell wall biosynthesis
MINFEQVKTEINKKKVLIIIPCYNEEVAIKPLLKEINRINLDDFIITTLPINDCSKDKTLLSIQSFSTDYLDIPINLGIGGAVQTGFKYALENNYDIAVQLDGDGQHPPEELIKILQPFLSENVDVVIGSRFINKQGFQSSQIRRVGILFFTQLNHVLFGIKIYDSTSGFRAINKKALKVVVNNYPDEYPEPESLITFHLNQLNILEIPVNMKERIGGVSSISTLNSLYYMIKVSLRIIVKYVNYKKHGKYSGN